MVLYENTLECLNVTVCFAQKLKYIQIVLQHILLLVASHNILPEPVLSPDPLHLFNRHILRLRQQQEHEHRHRRHPCAEEEENPALEMAQHRQKRLPNQESEQKIHRNRDTLPRRSYLQRKDLARNQPPQRAPRNPETGTIHTDQNQNRISVALA